MRQMSKGERKQIEREITDVLEKAISSEYAEYILEQKDSITENTLMEDVVQNVLETSAWKDERYYNEDDIRLAIGRELIARLGGEL